MSYTIQASLKRLRLQALALPLAALLIWLVPHRDIATNLGLWYLAPCWILLAHVLTALSYVITSVRLRPAWYLLIGSLGVYASMASATHLAAAFLTALGEEAVFRLALLPWLADHLGHAPAILLVSALFAGLHARGGKRRRSWNALADYFVFAIVLGFVTLSTRSLLPALILHTWRNYILRCLLVSREEYEHLKRKKEPA